MHELEIFKNEDFGKIRTIIIENQTWFIADDICKILEVEESRKAVKRLDNEEKQMVIIIPPNKQWIINESGLYSLILTMPPSRIARISGCCFQRWNSSNGNTQGFL